MIRIKKVFTLVHFVLWILLTFLVGLQLRTEGDSNWFTLTTGFTLVCLYVFYTHFSLLTSHSGQKKKGTYFLRLGGIVVTGPLLFVGIHYPKLRGWDSFLGYYGMALVSIVPFFISLSWLARITENLVLNTIRKEQLEKQAVEAELYYLKSQINPHFLFNTLNNIHTLVYKQAPAAPEAVQSLASLMRYMIYESNAPTVPLAREIKYLQDYVSLQQLRYRKSPVVDLKVKGNTASCHIAPLLFIHLLENAYKHSPARLEPGEVKVTMEIEANALTLCIQNPVGKIRVNAWEEPGGIGLTNVRKRLALLYPGQHSLEVNQPDDTFTVILKIQGLHVHLTDAKNHLLPH